MIGFQPTQHYKCKNVYYHSTAVLFQKEFLHQSYPVSLMLLLRTYVLVLFLSFFCFANNELDVNTSLINYRVTENQRVGAAEVGREPVTRLALLSIDGVNIRQDNENGTQSNSALRYLVISLRKKNSQPLRIDDQIVVSMYQRDRSFALDIQVKITLYCIWITTMQCTPY